MKNSMISLPVPSINFHLWEPCNMRCKFCFATFQDVKSTILPKGHLPKEEALRVVEMICKTNVTKITFAGGEPTLCPWLLDLLTLAKSYGKTTMIVTNGSMITSSWLDKFKDKVDWITLSIDSVQKQSNLLSGRAVAGKRVIDMNSYLQKCNDVKESGIRLKINTVVSQLNFKEKLSSFINLAKPERWKIFQVLPVKGQNDTCINDLIISAKNFDYFIHQNADLLCTLLVKESNDEMTNSYLMIDPAGRFYHNTSGCYQYSDEILKVGVLEAVKQIKIDPHKFLERDGLYDW